MKDYTTIASAATALIGIAFHRMSLARQTAIVMSDIAGPVFLLLVIAFATVMVKRWKRRFANERK